MGFCAWWLSGDNSGASSKEKFSNSGLEDFCKTINWDNPDHQRIVAAILVNAVYILEKERESTIYRKFIAWLTGSTHKKSYAQEWWEAVGFKKIEELFEDTTKSGNLGPSFGAIFEFSPSSSSSSNSKWKSTATAPAFVLAFRGTANFWDFLLDTKVLSDTANSLGRLSIANERVKRFFTGDKYKSEEQRSNQLPRVVWVAGHSLGGSVAISVAMGMIESKLVPLDRFRTFLFNPPFVSSVLGSKNPDSSVGKAFEKLEGVVGDLLQKLLPVRKNDVRESLYEWLPDIFVNPRDLISMWFVPYFREGYNNRNIQSAGTYFRASDGSDVGIPFINWTSGTSLHLLPSGNLHVHKGGGGGGGGNVKNNAEEMARRMEDPNRDSWLPGFIRAHLLSQWWDVNLQLEHDQPYYIRNVLISNSESKPKKLNHGQDTS